MYCHFGLPRHSSRGRHVLHVSLSKDRDSTERKHGSRAGSGFFPRTVQAWRTMEQLSGFLQRGSFVPPFPPAWLSLAKGQRLLESPLPGHLGGWGDCLGLGGKDVCPDAQSGLPGPPPWPQTLHAARSPTPGKSDSSSHPGFTEEVEPQLCSKDQLALTSAFPTSLL